MSRQPGIWLAIFFLSYGVYEASMAAFFQFVRGALGVAVPYLGVAVLLAVAAVALYLWWKRTQDEEARMLTAQWSGRFETLKSDMEAFLRSV